MTKSATDAQDFSSIRWGPDEAKGDNRLRDYFVTIPEYSQVVGGTRRYVVGRKGTGKTAILERIRLDQDSDPLIFSKTLSLRNFPLQTVRDLRDKSFRDKAQFVPVWKFLLVNALVDMVLDDNGAEPREVIDSLREFKLANFNQSSGFTDTVTVLAERQAMLTLTKGVLAFGGHKKSSTTTTVSIHYSKLIDPVINALKNIKTESTYFLLLDELDEGYRAGDPSLRLLLLALLRATEDVALELGTVTDRFRPIGVLRSDIFDRLEDNDLNKLDDHTVRLRWILGQDGNHSLRDVVNARIAVSWGMPVGDDLWPLVVDDRDPELPPGVESMWSYVSSRTMQRPRDIIKFLKLCGEAAPRRAGRLSFKVVQQAEHDYSDWLYRELRDEIHSHLPVWRESLRAVSRVGSGRFDRARLVKELTKSSTITRWMRESHNEPDDVIAALFDFGVIGQLRGGRWIFRYKDEDLSDDPAATLIVHYGFHKKLRLRDRDTPPIRRGRKN